VHSFVRLRARAFHVSAVLAVIALGACSSSNGPILVIPIAGTYTGSITYQLATQQPVTPGISLTIDDPDNNGNFGGSFAFNTGFTETGNIAAQVVSNGTQINWVQFGDSAQPLFYVGAFFANNYPACNFTTASFLLNQNGGFDGNGDLDLFGTFSGIHCAIDMLGDSDTTTMTVSLAVFNPTPFQHVAHALGLRAVNHASIQRAHH
jgi:hypothetical protein